MTAAYEVSAARESISAAEKMQQYFRDFRDFDTFEHWSFLLFLRVDYIIIIYYIFIKLTWLIHVIYMLLDSAFISGKNFINLVFQMYCFVTEHSCNIL